ncbi:Fcf1-domain-containing protein [Xylariales sp. PMI_506]|nr:Fcf1-domain-containing protein [Xylariales sp. PMI_506]
MGVAKRTRKFAQVKRVISKRDERRRENATKADEANQTKKAAAAPDVIREVPQQNSALFFQHNTSLVPPYQILVDTNVSNIKSGRGIASTCAPPLLFNVRLHLNAKSCHLYQQFLSHTVQRKLPLLESFMDLLYAKANPIITDCVMAELEKLGQRYRLALRIARDTRWERLKCDHKGVYADDCIVDRVIKHRVYLVATNDKDLKNRLRKIPGVPIVSVAKGKYVIERLPDAPI